MLQLACFLYRRHSPSRPKRQISSEVPKLRNISEANLNEELTFTTPNFSFADEKAYLILDREIRREAKNDKLNPAGRQTSSLLCYVCAIVPALVAVAIAIGVAVPLSNTPDMPNFDADDVQLALPTKADPTSFVNIFATAKLPDDGCGKGGVLFEDGNCYPLLRPCRNPLYWTTVNPITGKVAQVSFLFFYS